MTARDPLPRWSRWFLGVVGLCVVGLVAWGAWPKWSSATIGSATIDGTRLEINSDACGSDVRTDVDEGVDAVTLTVSVYDDGSQGDCSGSQTTASLDEPLGERGLVDGSDGVVLPCEPGGATTQQCVR